MLQKVQVDATGNCVLQNVTNSMSIKQVTPTTEHLFFKQMT